jgi:ADP-heptose:LPS heptosyltransferase
MKPTKVVEGAKRHRRALVIRLSSLGDVVLSTSVIAPLRSQGIEVDFLVKKSFAAALADHSQISSLRIFERGQGRESDSAREIWEWSQSREHDLVIDLQNSWRTLYWRKFWSHGMGAPRWIVLPKQRWREWLVLAIRSKSAGWGRGGRAKAMRAFVEQALNLAPSTRPLTELDLISSGRDKSILPLSKPYWVVVPHSAWKSKEWRGFLSVARWGAKNRGVSVVLLGAAKDEECDRIAVQLSKEGYEAFSLRGKTNLGEAKEVLAQAELVLGNDTGLLHMAEALGRPVLMVEGPTQEALGFSPYRSDSKVVGLDLWCRPCSKSGAFCWRWGSRACLKDLSPDQVIKELRTNSVSGGSSEG